MAHNLLQRNMAFVGAVPWHGLGERVSPGVSSAEMIQAAGLDWRVDKTPAIGARIISKPGQPDIHDRYFLQRERVGNETDGPVLGVVSHGYEVLQNEEAFAFFEPLLDAGGCAYETAGALGNGERVWVQVRMRDAIEVAQGDAVERYFLLSNSHDGRGALSLRFTPVRVVCQNTLNLATKGGESVVNIRHSRHMRNRLTSEQVAMLLQLIGETYGRAAKQFRRLATVRATQEMRSRFLEDLFPQTEIQRANNKAPKRWTMIEAALQDDRVSPRETRETLWALYNAVTRTEDYRVSCNERGDEARLARVWFGAGADLKVKALERAVVMAGEVPA